MTAPSGATPADVAAATADDEDITTTPEGAADDGADALGDAGKKALDAMKVKWQKERDARKALADQVAELTAPKVDDKAAPDAEKIRAQVRAEMAAEALNQRVMDKIEAKAAKLFADPEDAVVLLGRNVADYIDDGKVDIEAINDALADLLKKKPHLAAATPARFQGSADGGARKGSAPAQLTEQDLKRMTPEQIVKARESGQLADLL